jgi:hypothetical protein
VTLSTTMYTSHSPDMMTYRLSERSLSGTITLPLRMYLWKYWDGWHRSRHTGHPFIHGSLDRNCKGGDNCAHTENKQSPLVFVAVTLSTTANRNGTNSCGNKE